MNEYANWKQAVVEAVASKGQIPRDIAAKVTEDNCPVLQHAWGLQLDVNVAAVRIIESEERAAIEQHKASLTKICRVAPWVLLASGGMAVIGKTFHPLADTPLAVFESLAVFAGITGGLCALCFYTAARLKLDEFQKAEEKS
ncbi:hypothetical protein LU674_001555 [Pseudomonas alloputida]|uniref:Uncharacterized protein n=1 Tax=Pseudomonas alloputida TaxID=1940621 RepID=A0AAW7HLJ1_9PSED|nr:MULTISPECIES: hypothetical protein [Pseudomonas]KXK68097.1 hypothetical protein BC89_27355 [Pseudomonas monteilii]MDM3951037.1 hypothetical protein [Pseudomonas alloputida]TXI12264.1 MAG: hypothetical protein E6Q76_01290 [Rhizobium sp.]